MYRSTAIILAFTSLCALAEKMPGEIGEHEHISINAKRVLNPGFDPCSITAKMRSKMSAEFLDLVKRMIETKYRKDPHAELETLRKSSEKLTVANCEL